LGPEARKLLVTLVPIGVRGPTEEHADD
jgi:hypothetical protein